jgi:hypothetical protein
VGNEAPPKLKYAAAITWNSQRARYLAKRGAVLRQNSTLGEFHPCNMLQDLFVCC